MAKYGTFVYGDGTKYGRAPLSTTDKAIAGQSPSVPSLIIPWRNACAEIWTWDAEAWEPGVQLPYVLSDATQAATLAGAGIEQQSLSFSVYNYDSYYTNGAGVAQIGYGAWLCVKRTVTSPEGTVNLIDGVYRCPAGPSVTGPEEGATLQISAVDWAQMNFSVARNWLDWYVNGGRVTNPDMPEFLGGWGTLLGEIVNYLTSGHATGLSWDTATPDAQITIADILGGQGNPQTGYAICADLWSMVGSFRISYLNDTGQMFLQTGRQLFYSPYYISTDSTILGSIPLAWERPINRTVQPAQYTAVSYWYAGASGSTPEGVSTAPVPEDPALMQRSIVTSWSTRNPYVPGDAARVLDVVERDLVREPRGFPTFTSFCRTRLAEYLGSADTVTVAVDSAIPPGPLGRRMGIHVPPEVDGIYELRGYTRPLDEGPASWTFGWCFDNP